MKDKNANFGFLVYNKFTMCERRKKEASCKNKGLSISGLGLEKDWARQNQVTAITSSDFVMAV